MGVDPPLVRVTRSLPLSAAHTVPNASLRGGGACPLQSSMSSQAGTRARSGAITGRGGAGGSRAMRTAEDFCARLNTVTDDLAAAVPTHRSHQLDSALKAVKDMGGALRANLKRQVVVVPAYFTAAHPVLTPYWGRGPLAART